VNVVGGMTPRQTRIERNLIRNCGTGVIVGGATPQAVIVNNQIESITGPAGIDLTSCLGCLVAENTIREVFGAGACLRLTNVNGSKFFDNVINRCGLHGISADPVSNDNLFWKNVVTQAAGGVGTGLIIAGDRNSVEGNLLNFNAGRGLIFLAGADNNTYRQNTARGNAGAGACAGACGPGTDFCNGGVGNSSNGDNWLPVAPCL
jgi:hypothetical protein